MKTRSKGFWISLSILDFCIGTLLAATLRTKSIFELPSIDYTILLNVHSHFALGWVTLALMVLMVNGFLTESQKKRNVYQFVFWGIFICTWALLFTFLFPNYPTFSTHISIVFILVTYLFAVAFVRDIFKTTVSKTVRLLSVGAVVSLVLSSLAIFYLAYLFSIQSLDGILYRDSIFSYLHLQYNGFFTLAVFALLFQKLETKMISNANKNSYRFSVLLVFSILPSLFLSYLWHDTALVSYCIAVLGSVLVMASFVCFLPLLKSLMKVKDSLPRILRFTGAISIGAFMLKTFMQSFTIFSVIGNFVFGDRPIIMGFLHLVFLGFVALFLLSYITQTGFLDVKKGITKFAIITLACGIILNEILLWSQGISWVIIQCSDTVTWLLWGVSLLIFTCALLIGIARILSRKN